MPKIHRICCVCNRKIRIQRCLPCPACKAINYCSSGCQSRAADPSDFAYHAVSWCSKLKKIMSQSAEYVEFPFPWSRETTSFEFDVEMYASFLKQQGVLGQGLWRFEIPESLQFGQSLKIEDDYILPSEAVALQEDIATASPSLTNWRSYYELRGININSPICILLQWPLTLYHILVNELARDYPQLSSVTDSATCNIHILGVEKEANILYVFEELARLVPDMNFNLTLIGPSMVEALDGRSFALTRMRITLKRGFYHEINDLTIPCLVVGFNAGLAAYESWLRTIERLEANKVPAYFTDYCWPAVEFTREQFEKAGKAGISEGKLNPFRSPICVYSPESEIPRLSNGVLFHLVYYGQWTDIETTGQTFETVAS